LNKVDQEIHLIPRVKDMVNKLGVFDDLVGADKSGDLIDTSCCSVHWLMYGCRKDPKMDPYLVTKIINSEGNEVAVMDGEYTTAEGVIVVVADGLLVELKPMVEEPEVEVEVEEEKQSTDESLSKEVEGLLSLVAKLESELSQAKKANENLSSEVTKLSAQPAASSIKEVKQAKVNTPSKPYHKMSAEERFVFHLNK
jgi:hypothetical protein